jgi:hypothetical protein
MMNFLKPGLKGEQFVVRLLLLILLCFSIHANAQQQEPDWLFSVQLNASVQASPPQITLQWDPDAFQFGATGYTIYRKPKSGTSWGSAVATLPPSATTWTDTSVSVGTPYEYQVVKQGPPGQAFGYISTGINIDMVENRGKIILIVATNATATLEPELNRFQSDMIGDGWYVIRHDISSDDTPAHVRSLIVSDYNADSAQVNAVLLFGHVPVLQSGFISYDGHEPRAMPTDAYYGMMHGSWNNDANAIPGTVELMVGRVDVSDLPGALAPGTLPSETEMLHNYLEKNHRWRQKQFTVPRRALVADRFGVLDNGDVRASSGYRNFAPLVGLGNTELADVSDTAAPGNRWISRLANSYLWTYGNGGGQLNSISQLGVHGEYNDVWNTDLYSQDAKAVFFMLEGSHFGNWDRTDNIMRTVLGMRSMGLAVYCIPGRPQYYVHHIGLGEPLGYGVRTTMNNSGLYRDTTNALYKAVYIELLGDPTLRIEPLAPASGLNGGQNGGVVGLSWFASSDAVVGYHVYRSASISGPYTRLTTTPVSGTSFQDAAPIAGGATYMVRAVALQVNPSGSYYNPSQGAFLKIDSNGVGTPSGDTNTVVNGAAKTGLYNGLFYPAEGADLNNSGAITVTIAKKQAYSGKLTTAHGKFAFHGKLGPDGTATNTIGKGGASLVIHLSAAAEPDKIVGSVDGSDWSSSIFADRAVFNSKTNKTSLAGNYTLRLPGSDGDSTLPTGDGWALIKVSTAGVAKMAGVLGDNTKVTSSAAIGTDGTWPVFASLYGGKGELLGWLNFAPGDTEDITGTLNWIKQSGAPGKNYPAGFTNQVTASGSTFTKASKGGGVITGSGLSVAFIGGELDAPITNAVTIAGSKVTNEGVNKMTMNISPTTGKFAGKVSEGSSGKSLPFSGVILQKQNAGYGLLVGQQQTSRVILAP